MSCMNGLCFFPPGSSSQSGVGNPYLFVNVEIDGSKAFVRNIGSFATYFHDHFRIKPRKDGKLHVRWKEMNHVSVYEDLLVAQWSSVHLNSTVIQLHLTIRPPRSTVTLIGSFFEHSIRSSRPAGIL